MFLPLSASNSVGPFFSLLTMLREGVPPHMVQSSARVICAEESAKPQAAVRAARARVVLLICMFSVPARVTSATSFLRFLLLRLGGLGVVAGHEDVVVVDEARERTDQRVAEQPWRAVGIRELVFELQRPFRRLLAVALPHLAADQRVVAGLLHTELEAVPSF